MIVPAPDLASPSPDTRAPASLAPRPRLRLFTETVFVDELGFGERLEELEVGLIRLSFAYPGFEVGASDERSRVFCAEAGGARALERDYGAEAHFRGLLESFGAVELDCLEHLAVPPDVEADYVVRLDGDVHRACAFTAEALPKLEALGFDVDIDSRYAHQVTSGRPEWYASLRPVEERVDWFQLELGVDTEHGRVDLLPQLLDLLADACGDGGLEALLARQRLLAIPIAGRQHLVVSSERLRALMRVVVELYDGEHAGQARFGCSSMGTGAVAALDGLFAQEGEAIRFEGTTSSLKHIRPSRQRALEQAAPEGLHATLRPYQEQGLAWLQGLVAEGVGGVLADDMGLGKTLQTLAHIMVEKAAGRLTRPALVVAPKSLIGNWSREASRFAPSLRQLVLQGPGRHALYSRLAQVDLVLTSYPILVRDQERLEGEPFHLLVLDEAQAIKNPRSRTHLAARSLEASHRLCLTGTPVENHLGELWALFDFVSPGFLGSAQHFKHWYRQPIEQAADTERLSVLRERVKPYLLRRMKSQVAKELPPKTQVLVPVELTGKQRELYEHIRVAAHAQVRRTIAKNGLAASAVSILGALTKLRQVCCDPRLVKLDAARFVRESAKHERLMRLLEEQLAAGHRALVFSQFTSMLALISESLEQRGVRHLVLTGQSRKRQDLVDAFEAGQADVFLISLKAGGTGLNLVSADTVIHYDHWWNPQAQAQATDRAYRIGQTRPVFVHDLYVAGSVEERMLELQRRKRDLADAILGQGGGSPKLSEADVETLFAPLRS
ncbi:MAG: DEAD/DEAH box helicase [Deltaproteobacteria bacterium]|nr:DEAD/DEAH box helicase [Deltaproteobacteria bacterium]